MVSLWKETRKVLYPSLSFHLVLMLINLDNSTSAQPVKIEGASAYTVWTLSPGNGAFGTTTLMNGEPLPSAIVDCSVPENGVVSLSKSSVENPLPSSVTQSSTSAFSFIRTRTLMFSFSVENLTAFDSRMISIL